MAPQTSASNTVWSWVVPKYNRRTSGDWLGLWTGGTRGSWGKEELAEINVVEEVEIQLLFSGDEKERETGEREEEKEEEK